MVSTPDIRPSPESFLEAAHAEDPTPSSRGKLKIFLGASPGVGKTFAMLEEARAQKRSGLDVVVALVETHGRSETAGLLADLEILPRRRIDYKGQTLGEMDIDALLARKPRLALIDEFAHTNAPGSRHPKRWQDVMEVLDAGIDVLTTLNIQHIESLNDTVAQITGVRVQETVPDAVLARADAIELIDLPPEDLIRRMKEGKVYLPQQVGRALENFFNKGKLTALREIALRTTAGRVDADMLAFMRDNAVQGPWPAEERLLVCVNEAPVGKTLVRAGKQMADRMKIPWIVATVLTPRHDGLNATARHACQDAMHLAETLGAETVTLRAESDAAGEILRYARTRNVTRLVIGRARWPRGIVQKLMSLLREPVSEKLLDGATDFEVVVVTASAKTEAKRRAAPAFSPPPSVSRFSAATLEACLAITLATVFAWPFWSLLPVASIAVIYLVAVQVVAFRHGLTGALLGSALGFLAYNFFYTQPYYSFAVEQYEAVLGLMVFVISSVVTGLLESRLRAQIESMRAAQQRTETLFDFARKIASATKSDDVLWAAAAHSAKVLEARIVIMTPDAAGALEQVQGHPSIEEDLDPAALGAARWAFAHAEPAGAGTGTLPNSEWLFVPLATAAQPFGVIGVRFLDLKRATDPEMKRLLLAVEDQVAVAIERNWLADDLATARIAAESDKLRAALLNSVSHDLRTPLVSIIGAASTLAEGGEALAPQDRQALALTALDEARRLDSYVQNLLDMTRLGHGDLKPKRAAVDLKEIIGRVRTDLARILRRHEIDIRIARDFPMIDVDPVLIGQALANVLDNAAKYAPEGSAITIGAEVEGMQAVVSISDDGPGIPEGDREKVFDLFHRAARGDGAPGGTGMGLAIVRGLVEAHGGSVTAGPGPNGHGTRLAIRLPLAPPPLGEDGP
ncbi:sensor histidine kinase [Aquabacter cavernae]|uniref:sensor histidine kinase n=1 Tax=Aquabacter cavernae TaxID=2496029 RepID=UPI000F8CEC61|nr:sensor histidine kinase KdpD [Aquabacter cavernae]